MRVLKSLVENSRQLYSWHTRCELYTRPQHCPQCHNCEPRLRVTLMCTLYARFYGNLCTIKIDRVLSCIVLQELISCWLSVQPSVKVHCRPDPITKHQGLRSWLVSRFTPYVVMAASICSWCSRFCWCLSPTVSYHNLETPSPQPKWLSDFNFRSTLHLSWLKQLKACNVIVNCWQVFETK